MLKLHKCLLNFLFTHKQKAVEVFRSHKGIIMNLKDLFATINNKTTTENGNAAYISTMSANLDFFSMSIGYAVPAFIKAYNENRNLALANLLYARDRQQKGFRTQTREILFWVANNSELTEEQFEAYIRKFVFYGRWDDLLILLESKRALAVAKLIYKQLAHDMKALEGGGKISLLAKWLPSMNAGKKSNKTAKRLLSLFNEFLPFRMSSATYRKMLSGLRKGYDLVETRLTTRKPIDFDKVPAKAIYTYKKAFAKMPQYEEWLATRRVIKTTSMQVYQLCRDVTNPTNVKMWESLVAEWKEKDIPSFIVMGDVSGSMESPLIKDINVTPLDISVSLALFSAYVNPLGVTMTFTNKPRFLDVTGKSLAKAYSEITRDIGYNTNLELAVQNLLSYAKTFNVPQENMPKFLIIVSDMQFDKFGTGREVQGWNDNVQKQLSDLYLDAGYEIPTIVYWQVNNKDNFPVIKDTPNAKLIGGFNQTLLEKILTNTPTSTPSEYMLEVLSEYYTEF